MVIRFRQEPGEFGKHQKVEKLRKKGKKFDEIGNNSKRKIGMSARNIPS